MNDEYQKMSEMLDNWLSNSSKEVKMALIEKEILLEKTRKLYVQLSALETEEYEAPEAVAAPVAPASEPQKQFTPAKTLEEDVELFFDTEHESYNTVEQELKSIAEEINESQATVGEVKPEAEKKEQTASIPDIFDQIERPEESTEESEDSIMEDDADSLFVETDFEIKVGPEMDETKHAEDDILQFIPPKSTSASEKPVQAEVSRQNMPEKPAVQPPAPPKRAENFTAKPQQRSLNDLFNEKREDHSISSQYQRAKVGDLTKAISINDKFIYIKELFHNRGEDFSASIRQLNECKNMEEAFDCLEHLKQKFYWDSKSDAYLSFCDLLRRKYS